MVANNGSIGLEFNRFGGSLPSSYWGCCCADIIQNFNVDPDAKASIQIAAGDSGVPCMENGKHIFCGPTYKDIFHQRLRIGTFGPRDMPNHMFFAIITNYQLGGNGKKWLPILKEAGFEFLRSVSNSVGAGAGLLSGEAGDGIAVNHVFALFRNIGNGALKDPFTPPEAWTDLKGGIEAWTYLGDENGGGTTTTEIADLQRAAQLEAWNRIGPVKFLTEEEVVKAGAPVFLAGERSQFPPQEKSVRQLAKGEKVETASAFPAKTIPHSPAPMTLADSNLNSNFL